MNLKDFKKGRIYRIKAKVSSDSCFLNNKFIYVSNNIEILYHRDKAFIDGFILINTFKQHFGSGIYISELEEFKSEN